MPENSRKTKTKNIATDQKLNQQISVSALKINTPESFLNVCGYVLGAYAETF